MSLWRSWIVMIVVVVVLAMMILRCDANGVGTFENPPPTPTAPAPPVNYYVNPTRPFDVPLDRLTGLVGNATSFNIAVIMQCATASARGIQQPVVDATLLTKFIASAVPGSLAPPDYASLFTLIEQLKTMRLTVEQVYACKSGLPEPGSLSDYYYSFPLWQEAVNRQCNGGVDPATAAVGECGIPTSSYDENGTQLRARMNLVYFNVGAFPYGEDVDMLIPTYSNVIVLSNLLASSELGYPLGFFPVWIPPIFGYDFYIGPFSQACERTKSCITISAVSSTEEYLKCIPQFLPPSYTDFGCPVDCLAKSRGGCKGQRRYSFGFTASRIFDRVASTTITQWKVRGARTAALFGTPDPKAKPVMDFIREDFIEKGYTMVYENFTDWDTVFQRLAPPLTPEVVHRIAVAISEADPDVIMLVSSAEYTSDVETFARLLLEFQAIDWTPRAVSVTGGGGPLVQQKIYELSGSVEAAKYMYTTRDHDYRLKSQSYNNKRNPADPTAKLTINNPSFSFEAYASEPGGDAYGPEIFIQDYLQNFNDTWPLTIEQGYQFPQLAATVLSIPMKLLELAGTDDPKALQFAAYQLSVPSVGGLLQFDTYGRLVGQDSIVIQLGEDGQTWSIITPADTKDSTTDVYPMPQWAERVEVHETKEPAMEHLVAALNTLCITLIGIIAGFVIKYSRHPVIIAASPSCSFFILLGAAICLSSNYAQTLYPSALSCGFDVWLLTCGFSCMMGAIILKNARNWLIFRSSQLASVRLPDGLLLLILLGIVLVDITINTIWSSVAPFSTETIIKDPLRPRYNTRRCAFSGETTFIFIWLQLAWKCLLVLFSLVLTILARKVPSLYMGTTTLAMSNYNVSVLMTCLLPIIATQPGSERTTYLLRCYGLMLLVVSTISLLFLPRLWTLREILQLARAGIAVDKKYRLPKDGPIGLKLKPLSPALCISCKSMHDSILGGGTRPIGDALMQQDEPEGSPKAQEGRNEGGQSESLGGKRETHDEQKSNGTQNGIREFPLGTNDDDLSLQCTHSHDTIDLPRPPVNPAVDLYAGSSTTPGSGRRTIAGGGLPAPSHTTDPSSGSPTAPVRILDTGRSSGGAMVGTSGLSGSPNGNVNPGMIELASIDSVHLRPTDHVSLGVDASSPRVGLDSSSSRMLVPSPSLLFPSTLTPAPTPVNPGDEIVHIRYVDDLDLDSNGNLSVLLDSQGFESQGAGMRLPGAINSNMSIVPDASQF